MSSDSAFKRLLALPGRLRQFIRAALGGGWDAVYAVEPQFWDNLGEELVAGRQWIDRAIVLGYAIVIGLVVVGFTELSEAAAHWFSLLGKAGPIGAALTLVWTPLLAVGLLWWMRRYAPGAMGSGIPQVLRAVDEELPRAQRTWLVSLPLACHKMGMVIGGMLAGLSIGREGPTVQIGAGVMGHAKRWLSKGSGIDSHDLMVAGAAAGLAATFNTPLGGVVFALEQLSRRRSMTHSALMISSIVLAGLVAVSFFGNETYFGSLRVQRLSWDVFGPGLVVVLTCGLAGGLFSRLVVVSIRGLPDRFSRWRKQYPFRFTAACALGVAVIGLATGGATAGGGYAPARAMLEGTAELPGVFTLLKFCATWLSVWTGLPAGVFAPSLTIGAGIGHDVALLMGVSREAAIPLIALGMVSFLAAATQEPITAFIIVMEMVAGHAMVLSLMASSLLAAGVSRLLSKPLYGELAAMLPLPPVTLNDGPDSELAAPAQVPPATPPPAPPPAQPPASPH